MAELDDFVQESLEDDLEKLHDKTPLQVGGGGRAQDPQHPTGTT